MTAKSALVCVMAGIREGEALGCKINECLIASI